MNHGKIDGVRLRFSLFRQPIETNNKETTPKTPDLGKLSLVGGCFPYAREKYNIGQLG